MPSFEEILNMPASEIKPPKAFPVGTYHCIVDGIPSHEKSTQRGTDSFQFKFKIIGPYKDVDPAAAAEAQVQGAIILQDFYVTDKATWRLVEMLKDHLDIPETNLKEMISQAPNKQLLVTLRHEASPDGKRVFHRVASTAHV
jgi:hypothetical protein